MATCAQSPSLLQNSPKPIDFADVLTESDFSHFNASEIDFDLDAFLALLNARFPSEQGSIGVHSRDLQGVYLVEEAFRSERFHLARHLANVVDPEGNNLLMLSIQGLQKANVKILCGLCDGSARNQLGLSALDLAASRGDVRAVLFLLQAGVQDTAAPDGKTALMRAADRENSNCVRELVQYASPQKVQRADRVGNTALIFAARTLHQELVGHLLPKSSIDWCNHRGEDALFLTVKHALLTPSEIELLDGLWICRHLAPQGHHGTLTHVRNADDVLAALPEPTSSGHTLFSFAAQQAQPRHFCLLEILAPYAQPGDLVQFASQLSPEHQELLREQETPLLHAAIERALLMTDRSDSTASPVAGTSCVDLSSPPKSHRATPKRRL